jgi:Fur family ferric uptake transcriptional regulator
MGIAIVWAVETWAMHAAEVLRGAGYRRGGARRAVVEFLGQQACCISAQEIHDGLRAQGRAVGIASVYRVLDLLMELRLVQRVELGDDVARYESVDPGGVHHHHLVCDDCGRVDAFTDDALERVLRGVDRRVAYAVAAHDVTLRGACDECRTVASAGR